MSQSDAGYELLSRQMQNLELQATEQISLFKRQQERLEQRQQELALNSDSDDEESAEQNAAANEVREQARILDDSQVSLAIAFAQLKAARTNQEIGNVLTDKKSFALVGILESVVGRIDQRIGNVSTTDEASALQVAEQDHALCFFLYLSGLTHSNSHCPCEGALERLACEACTVVGINEPSLLSLTGRVRALINLLNGGKKLVIQELDLIG
jgi:multidrug efflux pump subunit AcrA (membrane-fusion protein)